MNHKNITNSFDIGVITEIANMVIIIRTAVYPSNTQQVKWINTTCVAV